MAAAAFVYQNLVASEAFVYQRLTAFEAFVWRLKVAQQVVLALLASGSVSGARI
jgi:hypothetical protein